MKIPFVNLFYDLIFDKAPTEEQAAALVNLLGIIGALLLSMAVALPTSVESAPAFRLEHWCSAQYERTMQVFLYLPILS